MPRQKETVKLEGQAAEESNGRSRLTCTQCDRMMLDALEGALGEEDQAQFDGHLLTCSACSKALGDAQRGAAWMDMLKVAPPEPPSTLVGSILAQTSGNPAEALPVLRADTILRPASVGGTVLPSPAPAARAVWGRLPMMAQPRFAMTAAMAFFSVALTMNLAGVHVTEFHLNDLRPAAIKRTFWGANARAIRYYDNLRVVYELQARVRELQRDNGNTEDRAPVPSDNPDRKSSGPAEPAGKTAKPQGSEPRSGNRPQPTNRGGSRVQGQRREQSQRERPNAVLVLASAPSKADNISASSGKGARA